MSTFSIKEEVPKLLNKKKSITKLSDNGYLPLVDELFRDPSVVYHVMNAYDLSWTDDNNQYKDNMDFWHDILEKAEQSEAPANVINAVIDHIFRMTNARPLGVKAEALNMTKTENSGNASYMYPQYDKTPIAAEPDNIYGKANNTSSDNDWISYVNSDKRPSDGERVLVCGYYFAGSIDYGVATWLKGDGWKLPFDTNPNLPDFTVLYWKPLDECPKSAYNEVVKD